ncbi:hypothetical protein PMAYCL1PPCAC_22349, partial [Pristionchus mayeri]
RATDRGLLVVLSNNQFVANDKISPPPMWYDTQYSEEIVVRLWNALVNRYRNQWNVFAIDLKNEPWGDATWGSSNMSSDWNKAAERMIKGMSSFIGIFFVDGVNWGLSLEYALEYPVKTGDTNLDGRIVYTPHCYGPTVINWKEHEVKSFQAPNFPNNLDQKFMTRFGFLVQHDTPIVIGEWGAITDKGSVGEKWNEWYVEWIRQHCVTNNFYWSLDPSSAYSSGLLEADWLTPNPRKLHFINRAQPNPTKFELRNG